MFTLYLARFAERNPVILALIAGLFFASSWPPVGAFPLQLLGFVPLFFLAESFHGKSIRTFFLLSSLSFFIWSLGTLYWIAHASFLSLVAAVLIFTLISAGAMTTWLFVSKLALTAFRRPLIARWFNYAMLIALWVCLEGFKEEFINFPWLNLGQSLASFPQLVQFYEFTGPAGGTIVVLVVNVWVFELIKEPGKNRVLKGCIGGLLVAVVVYSIYRYYTFKDYNRAVEVRVVQAGAQFFNPLGSYQPALPDTLIARSVYKALKSNEYFIWPESAFESWHSLNEDSLEGLPSIVKIRAFLRPYRHGNVIFGALTYKTGLHYVKDTVWYNSAISIASDQNIQIYHKSRLVPGSEGSVFRVMLPGFTGHSLTQGTAQNNFYALSGIGVAPVICFESAFASNVSQKVRAGAQFITVITNDAWWGRSSGTFQHLAYARLLAIENRRWVVRSSMGGISAIIDATGDVVQKLSSQNSGTMSQEINSSEDLTFYTLHGNYLVVTCTALLALLLLVVIVFYLLNMKRHA